LYINQNDWKIVPNDTEKQSFPVPNIAPLPHNPNNQRSYHSIESVNKNSKNSKSQSSSKNEEDRNLMHISPGSVSRENMTIFSERGHCTLENNESRNYIPSAEPSNIIELHDVPSKKNAESLNHLDVSNELAQESSDPTEFIQKKRVELIKEQRILSRWDYNETFGQSSSDLTDILFQSNKKRHNFLPNSVFMLPSYALQQNEKKKGVVFIEELFQNYIEEFPSSLVFCGIGSAVQIALMCFIFFLKEVAIEEE